MKKKLSGEELVALLNGGGWEVVGGRERHDRDGRLSPYPVVSASVSGRLCIIVTTLHTYEVESDDICLVDEWLVEVSREYLHRQQRKKVDGGGFIEVSAIGVALRLSNPAIEKVVKKAREAEEWEKQREHLRREEEERRENELAFGEKLTKEYVGKKLVSVSVFDGTITLEFADGSDLVIALAGGDLYDAWINVNEISLRTFEFNRD